MNDGFMRDPRRDPRDARLSMPARGPHYGVGPKGYRRPDERVRDEVCERMALDGYVDVRDVEVDVQGGVVTLRGSVATRSDRRRLEDLAVDVWGVEDIHNDLRVRRAEVSARAVLARSVGWGPRFEP